MPTLPRELYIKIIDQLRRPLPPADQGDIGWDAAHQHDLSVMMRVNKVSESTVLRISTDWLL